LRTDLPPGGADALRAAVGHSWEVREVIVDDDGLDAWRDHAEVVLAGEHLVVHPPWVALDGDTLPDDPLVLEIDPGRSFGHGAHPTTRLCLEVVERACRERVALSVLDVGCGSGVLAVAAASLGAGRVTACDIDDAATTATGANAARNGVADRIDVVHVADAAHPLAGLDGPYDLVVANIGAATLVEIATALLVRAADDGIVVISGVLHPVDDELIEAFGPWRPERVEVLERWAAVVLRSPRSVPRDVVGVS
jgi:ribosomal protein L11 methyltransferase